MGFNLTAYICGIGSNFTQALYLLLVQRHSEQKMSVVETLQLNSYNTLPLLTFAALANGELTRVHEYPRLGDFWFMLTFFLSISVGMMLNYSLFLCTSLTSALTTSVVGGFKAMAQTVLGILTFGGVSNNMATYIGITMNLSGGIGYIFARYTENKSKMGSFAKVMSFQNLAKANHEQDTSLNSSYKLDSMSHRSVSIQLGDSESENS